MSKCLVQHILRQWRVLAITSLHGSWEEYNQEKYKIDHAMHRRAQEGKEVALGKQATRTCTSASVALG